MANAPRNERTRHVSAVSYSRMDPAAEYELALCLARRDHREDEQRSDERKAGNCGDSAVSQHSAVFSRAVR